MQSLRVVHYLNQFFAGIGGETQAGIGPRLEPGPLGPGRLLEACLGAHGRVIGTLICGDDAFHRDPDGVLDALTELSAASSPDVLIAGPAFDAGRYGLACGRLCETVSARLGIPAVTAMSPGNPAVAVCARGTYILPAGETALGMRESLERLAAFALKLTAGTAIGPAADEGYLPRGRRLNVFAEAPAAERVVDLLVRKLNAEPYASEVAAPALDDFRPAAPVADLAVARLALATEGGIVPRGNPDHLESRRATAWRKYPLPAGRLAPEAYECVHSGFDTRWIQDDPNRVLPADVVADLAKAGRVGTIHGQYYVTVGVGTGLEEARRFGREMAADLGQAGVEGVIMTAT